MSIIIGGSITSIDASDPSSSILASRPTPIMAAAKASAHR